MTQESLHFTDKGLKPFTKLILLGGLSFALLFADLRWAAMAQIRSYLITVTAPIQRALTMPINIFTDAQQFFFRQSTLVSSNKNLVAQNTLLSAKLAQMQTLAQENAQLKKLLKLNDSHLSFITAAEVISSGQDTLAQYLTIDQGSANGVETGQAVVDASGLIGQITATGTHNAQIRLLNHQNSIIPVMVARTGFRTLLYGDSHRLDLRYFPADADLKMGDLLVTSGIDANFPAGIPVARVTRLETAVGTPYYRAQTVTLGNTDAVRYVLIMPKNHHREISGLPEKDIAERKMP